MAVRSDATIGETVVLSAGTMSHAGPASDACYNCAAPLCGAYCSACGQKALPLNPRLRDFLQDFTHEMLHVDGKIYVVPALRTAYGGTRWQVFGARSSSSECIGLP